MKLLGRLLGRKKRASPPPPPKPPPVFRIDDYYRYEREREWKDQGLDLLRSADDFEPWVKLFRPTTEATMWRMPMVESQVIDNAKRGCGFEVLPPTSYPAIVVYTRIRRTGLTECEFYWDYVYPSDFFPALAEAPAPSGQDAANS